MKFSELIAAYGDDKVQFQNLDESATHISAGMITFITDESFGLDGTVRLGLVLWLDRKRVAEIIATAKED